MSSPDPDSKFKGVWLRALNEPSLENLTPELIVEWAASKGLANPVATARGVGAFHPTPRASYWRLTAERLAFPKACASGDSSWDVRRRAKEDEALLWKKMEWFAPLWLPMGKIQEMLSAVRNCTNEEGGRAFRLPHINSIYAVLPGSMYRTDYASCSKPPRNCSFSARGISRPVQRF